MAILDICEGREEDDEEHEQDNDTWVTPTVLRAAPLQRHEEAGYSWDDEEGAEQVHAREFLPEGEGDIGIRNRVLEAVDGQRHTDDAQWQIDAEAGTPAECVDEDTADHGRRDEANRLTSSDYAGHEGDFVEWEAMSEESCDAADERAGAQAGKRAADDEGFGAGREGAEEGAGFEDDDRGDEDVLDGEDGVGFAEAGWRSAKGGGLSRWA